MTLHLDRNTTVPGAVGKVNGHSIRVGRKLQLADNAGGSVLVRMLGIRLLRRRVCFLNSRPLHASATVHASYYAVSS